MREGLGTRLQTAPAVFIGSKKHSRFFLAPQKKFSTAPNEDTILILAGEVAPLDQVSLWSYNARRKQ